MIRILKKIFCIGVDFLKMIIAAITWVLAFCIFFPSCLLLAALPAALRYDNRFYFMLTYFWNRMILMGSFIKIDIEGLENLPRYPNNPSIVVLNHTSSYDIHVAEFLVGAYPHIWLTKAEYTKIPFVGFLLKRMHVSVDRDNSLQASKALLKAIMLAGKKARHLILFPEGTRFNDGKIHEFRTGFSVLAYKLQRPVVPIAIIGMHRVFPKGRIMIDSSVPGVKLVVGRPLSLYDGESREDFALRVKNWFETTLASS